MLYAIEKKAKNVKRAKTKTKCLYATLLVLIFTMSLKGITESFLEREFSGLFSDVVLVKKSEVFLKYNAQQIFLQYYIHKPDYKEPKLDGNGQYENKHPIRIFTYTPKRLWVSARSADGDSWKEPFEFRSDCIGENIANLVADDLNRLFFEIQKLEINSKGQDLYNILMPIIVTNKLQVP